METNEINAGIKGRPKLNNALWVFSLSLGVYCTFCKWIYTETFIEHMTDIGCWLDFNIY